ncbi:antitoxin VapB [Rhizobium skierniewicense]|uniref:Antitoxin VapB n=1 Tax=Rhizobium skierniewicense TaxID=984260 RepID=A0A7W6CJ15_9HYPH|nr:AbrB/MazE/SpoVT family DNA-binding domain-containing protein [Rhizobium skierniewicense]MBB3948016.1 antitoxin VapB [Rhizobium skierniewicense]
MSAERHVKLFRNGRNQAVRIPVEFELPGDEAVMHRDGDRLIIEPTDRRKGNMIEWLRQQSPLDEDVPEFDLDEQPPRSVDL